MVVYGMACIPQILSLISSICFLFESCWLIILIVKDITSDFESLDMGGVSSRGRLKIKERFREIIRNYLDAKQLSHRLFDIFRFRYKFDIKATSRF